jgi:tetratricopeptide (TPR) repeat protein
MHAPAPTVQDWLARAEEAQEPAEVRRCLDEAARAASGAWDLRLVLQAEVDLEQTERLEALALRALEAAEGEDSEFHTFTDVARIRLETLADRPGALEALRRAWRWLERPVEQDSWRGPPVWDWCQLARTWLELLGDREEALQCVARAEALCKEPGHLCTVAGARSELLGDLPSARALVELAEETARGREVWTVANAWRALEDATSAERLLERALREASETDLALTLARAWSSHDRPERAAEAIARAAELARTAEEWLAVAGLRAELGHERPLIRQALDAAAALTSEEDLDLRGQLSGAYHRWLGEPWSSRLGPLGHRPASLRPVVRPLPGFAPDAEGLFDHLRSEIPRASLQAIAALDYGMDTPEHLAVLTDLCASGLLPVVRGTLPWHPREVLELSRWARGERVDHQARALATTILSFLPGQELTDTVPYLVESALVLGEPVPALAEGMLAWLCSLDEEPAVAALLGLALLRLAQDPADERIAALLEPAGQRDPERFLRYCTVPEQWHDLARGVAGPLAQERPQSAGRLLRWLGGS